MRPALLLLCALAVLGGCSLNDCSVEAARSTLAAGRVSADGSGVGRHADRRIHHRLGPEHSGDDRVWRRLRSAASSGGHCRGRVRRRRDGLGRQPGRPATDGDPSRRHAVRLRRGLARPVRVRADLLAARAGVEVDVRAILVPEGTVAARVATVSASEVSPSAAAALRAAEDLRRLSRPIHI